jgi:hypothetical protein
MVRKIKSTKKFTKKFMKMGFGNDEGEEILTSELYYDENGNMTEEQKFDEETGAKEVSTFEYSEQQKLIKHHLSIESDGISETMVYNRDEKGRLIEEVKYYSGDEGEKILFEYSSHDLPVKIQRFDSDGDKESDEELEYDSSDRLIKHLITTPDGSENQTSELTYGDNGKPKLKIVNDSDGDLESKTEFAYDDKERLIRMLENNDEGKVVSDIATIYDERDNIVERSIKDYHTRTLKYVYDKNDNCIEESILDEHGKITKKNIFEFN